MEYITATVPHSGQVKKFGIEAITYKGKEAWKVTFDDGDVEIIARNEKEKMWEQLDGKNLDQDFVDELGDEITYASITR